MNIRRILYIGAFCLIVAFLYYNQQSEVTPIPPTLSEDSVLESFQQKSQIPEELAQTGYEATDIFFPDDYQGQAGDEFYVTLAQGDKFLTFKYLIRTQEKGEELEYYLKDKWENYKPPAGKFRQYQRQDSGWKEIS
jgi:hypothetical protein